MPLCSVTLVELILFSECEKSSGHVYLIMKLTKKKNGERDRERGGGGGQTDKEGRMHVCGEEGAAKKKKMNKIIVVHRYRYK